MQGFYRGLLSNLIGVTPEKAIKLTVNDFSRNAFSKAFHYPNADSLPVWMGMISGGIAGLCQVVATTPMEMMKINMQMSSSRCEKPTTIEMARRLGLGGMYAGTAATLMRYVHVLKIPTFFKINMRIEIFRFP